MSRCEDPFYTSFYRAIYTRREQSVYRLPSGTLVVVAGDEVPEGSELVQRVTPEVTP